LSGIQRYPYGVGQNGYDNHSMIKAFIVYALEGYRSIPQLIRELKCKPYFSRYVLGFGATIPHNSKFYRFINSFDAEIIRKLLAQVNKEIYADNLPQSIAIDSKPIKSKTQRKTILKLSEKIYPIKKINRREMRKLHFVTSQNQMMKTHIKKPFTSIGDIESILL